MIFGIHTFTQSAIVTSSKAFGVIAHAKEYRDKTGEIVIITVDDLTKSYRKLNATYTIKYRGFKGITWTIRPSHEWEGYRLYCIEATINPRVLSSGLPDYFTAANQEDVKLALEKFAPEPSKISSILGGLTFKLNRIDFCINFDIKKLGYACTVDDMFRLIKCANIPYPYKEWKQYDDRSHRMETEKTTFYLTSRSVVINCYIKSEEQYRKYGWDSDIPTDVIRFEIQCKYLKIYNLKNKHSKDYDVEEYLLSDEFAKDILIRYFNRTIMGGDYYVLTNAIKKIKSYRFSAKKEKRLIDALKYVNTSRGIAKAKDKLKPYPDMKIDFNESLRELVDCKRALEMRKNRTRNEKKSQL